MSSIHFHIANMKCGNCAKRIQALFNDNPAFAEVVVTTEVATKSVSLNGDISLGAAKAALSIGGYQWTVLPDAQAPRLEADAAATQVQTETTAPALAEASNLLQFHVPKMNCNNCLNKIRAALNEARDISADFEQKILSVKSDLSASALMASLATAGYPAELINDATTATNANARELTPAIPAKQVSEQAPEQAPEPKPEHATHSSSVMTLFVAEMSCASCVAKIEQAFAKQSGLDAKVNLADKQVRISGATDDAQVLAILASVGFQGQLIVDASQAAADKARHDKAQYRTRIWQAGFGLAAGVPLMLWGLLGGSMTIDSSASQLGWGIVGLLTLALMVLTGSHFYRGFWRSLKAKSANMDTLIALGTASAWLFSMLVVLVPEVFPAGTGHVYFEASVMILGLINLGHALELRARGKTSEAVQKLLGLQANTAVRVGPQGDEVVAISDLALGDVLRLKPGDRVALDGVVVSGESLLDESMLTGEPLAVSKALGDGVSAGTVNGNGALTYQVSAIASDTKLAKIISLVQEAQTSKMPIGRLTDKIAAYFVPVVVVIALLASAIWLGFGPTPALSHALVVLVSVLIIACPCALGLATPMSIMVAVGRAAQMGVLIKNGEALQTASKVTTVVLDKTGTITLGKPQVTDIMLFNQASSVNAALTQEQVLSKVASLEMASSHPLAAAIIDSASVLASHASNQADVTDFINHQGQGLSANIGAATWLVGNQSLMLNHDIAISAEVDAQQLAFTAEGKTPVWVGASGELVALIMISDPLKADAKEAVTKLKQQGLRVVMLSGDNQVTAQAVAKKVGIDEVIAQVLPHEKQAVVLDLQRQGEVVAMVGDGINDAPALMSSDVGIAMGSGTEVAIESADITLLSHQLMTLVDALALSRASMRNIKQNLFGAFIYNTLGIPIAAGVLFPVFGILLSPVVAGGAMALSSLTVVMNANRLKSTRLH